MMLFCLVFLVGPAYIPSAPSRGDLNRTEFIPGPKASGKLAFRLLSCLYPANASTSKPKRMAKAKAVSLSSIPDSNPKCEVKADAVRRQAANWFHSDAQDRASLFQACWARLAAIQASLLPVRSALRFVVSITNRADPPTRGPTWCTFLAMGTDYIPDLRVGEACSRSVVEKIIIMGQYAKGTKNDRSGHLNTALEIVQMSFVTLRAEIGVAQPVGATVTLIAYGSNFSLFFFSFVFISSSPDLQKPVSAGQKFGQGWISRHRQCGL
ncbi:hypothetical protein QBC42DRAFT_271643 [Cladorrhinum samala]|uniref:Uncharacterized protein n=1 Tax=Cladorrhinum samala TaxID=585594 RepID=A0AAV9HN70_9PEZI|nr:hypothetical protein QBC42DRAFT_271643 [Cladorrhinum samala]